MTAFLFVSPPPPFFFSALLLLALTRLSRPVPARPASPSLLAAAARRRNLGGAHEVANVLLQKLVVAVELVVLLAHRLYTVEDGDERLLQRLGMPVWEAVSTIFVGLATGAACLRSSSRASLPMRSMSSLVLRGLMALTSSGPKCGSTGPTAELSRGTTRGPLLFRLGSRGRVGMGWWIMGSLLSEGDVDTEESHRSIELVLALEPMDRVSCSSMVVCEGMRCLPVAGVPVPWYYLERARRGRR